MMNCTVIASTAGSAERNAAYAPGKPGLSFGRVQIVKA
jgi:hypothetical protein